MRVLVLFNPSSGMGRGRAAAETVSRRLINAGHDVMVRPTRRASEGGERRLEPCGLMVVVGGDGTVHHAAAAAAEAGVPVYHYPLGTENLFAREFGMSRDVERLAAGVAAWKVREVDLPTLRREGHEEFPFLIMASLGPDAGVVARLTATRRGPISHLSYLGPSLREFFAPMLPDLRVLVDGREVVAGGRGMLVVANMRQYGVRLDPAIAAQPDDGQLDVVFFPASGSARLVVWLAASRLRRHTANRRLVYERGGKVEVRARLPGRRVAFQVDGELGGAAEGELSLAFGFSPARLKVLLPG